MDLLESKKRQLETVQNAMRDLEDALASSHYAGDYVFKAPPNATEELKQPILKRIASALNDRGVGFDPSLLVQHVEKEVLRQFNEVVESSIKGLHVSKLMSIKHEAELFDIKDRIAHFSSKLDEIEAEILKLTTGVPVTKEKVENKKKK